MAAKITITLSDELLVALRKSKTLKLSLGGGAGRRAAPARGARRGGRRGRRVAAARPGGRRAKASGAYREGSHPSKLVAWASGRKRPFGVSDVMKALGIKRSHANMVLTRVVRDRAIRREGRGEYAAA